MKKRILIALGGIILAGTALASSDMFEFTADRSQLASEGETRALYARLAAAVTDYCGDTVSPGEMLDCENQVLDAVVLQIGNERLSALHAEAQSSADSFDTAARESGA